MILITYNDKIIDYVDRYEIVDDQGETKLVKIYPNVSANYYYNGMVNRHSFEYFNNIILPEDYYNGSDEDDNLVFWYTYNGTAFVKNFTV